MFAASFKTKLEHATEAGIMKMIADLLSYCWIDFYAEDALLNPKGSETISTFRVDGIGIIKGFWFRIGPSARHSW